MSDALLYTRRTRNPLPTYGWEYLNNYLIYTSDALPYTRGTRILRLHGVRNYLKNYIAIYKHLTHSRICVELASHAYMGLGIF